MMMRGLARGVDTPHKIAKGTLPRIWGFARPYRRWLTVFLLLTVASAVVGVATPLLAGQVVNVIVGATAVDSAARAVIILARSIAGLAVHFRFDDKVRPQLRERWIITVVLHLVQLQLASDRLELRHKRWSTAAAVL